VAKNRGEAVEYERRYAPAGHPGVLRVLGFWNREHGGNYREAVASGVPDLTPTRRQGADKYGFGVNAEQELAAGVGVFGRYGWSDGKTESWAFTEIDRTVSGGLSVSGSRWRRATDQFGAAMVRNYLSGDHRAFLAAGGYGFLIGDGRLRYGPESIVEAYYACSLTKWLVLTADYQHVMNPAYNRDRGPVSVGSLRIHIER
jgi:high affinity Mn2+ porin